MWIDLDDAALTQMVHGLRHSGEDHLAAMVEDKIRQLSTRSGAAFASYVEVARQTFASDDIQIDDDAVISESDDGAFVMGWLWIGRNHADRLDALAPPI